MKPKKTNKNIFTPKKVRFTKHESKKRAAKKPRGDRFGKRWFPYSKEG